MEPVLLMKSWESHPILHALTSEQKKELLSQMEYKEVSAGCILLHEGMYDSDLFLLIEGMARNVFTSDEGEEITVLYYHPNDVIGLVSAISHRRTQFSIQTITNAKLLKIPHAAFEKLLRDNYQFAEKIMRVISQRFDTLYQEIQQEHSYYATGFETHPYRKKVGEIMTSPVITIQESDSFQTIAATIHNHRISSLVVSDPTSDIRGIITREDLIRTIANDPQDFSSYLARDIMSSSLITLTPEAFYYEALLLMAKHQIEHIPIVSNQGALEGIITIRNLTEARGSNILSVVDEIESADSLSVLIPMREKIYQLLTSMVRDNASAQEMCHLITECNDRLVRKILTISEQALRAEGCGNPPVEYCWLTMGSEGRREQTLGTDQDNAIIYGDIKEEEREAVDRYFAALSEKIVSALEQCGFPRCTGNVMATNPRWRHSISGWKQSIYQWLESVDAEELRNFTIFLDFRAVYGNQGLAAEVRNYLFGLCKEDRFLLHRLAEDDAEYQVPLGVFGRIITGKENGHPDEINIKHGGVMHIVNAMRIFALREGVQAVSSMERLEALAKKELFSKEDVQSIQEAFNTFMVLRIRQNLAQMKEGKEATHYLSVKELRKTEYILLKKSLSTTKWLQQLVAYRLQGGGRL